MITTKKIANMFSDNNRLKKFKFFMDCFKPTSENKILDVGAEGQEYQVNSNILEKKYPYPENITVLGVDDYKEFSNKYPTVKAMSYDGRNFPFQDKSFDMSYCQMLWIKPEYPFKI